MHQVLFPLVIVTILKQHGSKEQPLTISQIADKINRQYAPFADGEKVMNRSTVARTLESLVLYTEVGDLLDLCVIEGGSANKKKYYIEHHKIG